MKYKIESIQMATTCMTGVKYLAKQIHAQNLNTCNSGHRPDQSTAKPINVYSHSRMVLDRDRIGIVKHRGQSVNWYYDIRGRSELKAVQ